MEDNDCYKELQPLICGRGNGSSIVFVPLHEETVIKITTRNSMERATFDYHFLRALLDSLGYSERLQASEFSSIKLQNGDPHKDAVCIKQSLVRGETIAQLGKEGLVEYLKENPDEVRFLRLLICFFLTRARAKKLYPDLVGNPGDQSLWNSVNIMLDQKSGKLVIVDTGLSPHEDTLRKYGNNFFDSGNAQHYIAKMEQALQ